MKLIVAGGRNLTNYVFVKRTLDYFTSKVSEPIEIVSGACSSGKHTFTRKDGTKVYGADGLGERWAEEKGYVVYPFPAQWDLHGKQAGYFRNKEMAEYGTNCVVFWDGESKGSKMMYELATQYKLPTKLVLYKD